MCWTQNEIETWFHKIKIFELCFIIWFGIKHFVMNFLCLTTHIYIFSFIVIYIHLRCYITIDVHLIVCVYVKEKSLKDLLDQIFCQCSSYVLFFKLQNNFDLWYDLIKHHVTQAISNFNPLTPLQGCLQWNE
jgi:hypothetical protein